MPKPRFGVVVFPGSNCDHDAWFALHGNLGCQVDLLWHKEHTLRRCDVVVLPGGFSYGDYLRSGAIAKTSPILQEVTGFAEQGGVVLGICNGFQVLTECGLLPGVLLKNASLNFVCKDVTITALHSNGIFTNAVTAGVPLTIPIAHGEGNYYAEPDVLAELEAMGQVLFRYCNTDGAITQEANPNGSANNIAGICNKRGNVFGLMPHPERACSNVLGKEDGKVIFNSIINWFTNLN